MMPTVNFCDWKKKHIKNRGMFHLEKKVRDPSPLSEFVCHLQ